MEKNMKNITLSLLVALVFGLLSVGLTAFATAQPEIEYTEIYLNGHYVSSETFAIERGDMLNVKVLFKVSDTSESGEVKVKAWIDGYRESIEAESARFDVFAGRLYSKTLLLDLPADMENGEYTLHVMITGKTSVLGDNYKKITLAIQRPNYELELLSIDVALPAVVKAGEQVVSQIVVKNRGSHKIEDIFVSAKIEELGIAKRIYIGDLYPNDYTDNTERDTKVLNVLFQIPKDTKSGTYTLKVKAENENAVAEGSTTFKVEGVEIKEEEVSVTEALAISVPSESKSIEAGKAESYQIVLTNLLDKPLTVRLDAIGISGWAEARFNPSQVIVLNARESKIVGLDLSVRENAIGGSHVFSIQASSEKGTVSKSLVAEVKAKTREEEKNNVGFWIAIILLAAIAIGLLIALIIIATRKPEEPRVSEIYY